MSALRDAISKIKQSASESDLIPHRRSNLGAFLQEKEYVYSSDDFSDDNSGVSSKNEQKRAARREKKEQSRSRLSTETRDGSMDTTRSELKGSNDSPAENNDDTPEMKARYGDLPMMQSRDRPRANLAKFESIIDEMKGQELTFRARLHVVRRMGAKFAFLVFRQQLHTLQGVLHTEPKLRSANMIYWAERIPVGSILKVKGRLKAPDVPVFGTTIHNLELEIEELHVAVRREEPVPFSVYEAELAGAHEERLEGIRQKIPDRTRLSNRILDLRTDTSQSIFRIQSAISTMFRSCLDAQNFIEIHSPKLQAAATESGASVFGVNYFGRPAFLAQSPQLAKQMAIASDFERVYEIGAVFRAENSNTHRHLTEYTGLDIEMAIEEHYHEALEVLDSVLKSIFKTIYEKYRLEIEVIKHHFPSEDLVWLDETPIISFADGVKMLNDSGWVDENGNKLSETEDFGTRDEIRLGELVKEKFHTDYYILDKFPATARPFYAMPHPDDERFTLSFDIFVRGQEIVSGGQRIHHPDLLDKRMREVGIDPSTMEEYMEGFKWGAPPHAGAGIGLERLLMLILKLGNIRLGSLFHRDPKSFPRHEQPVPLRHPEASTLNPPWQDENKPRNAPVDPSRKLQALEDLIANYGDSTSTSWLDDRYKIWRDYATGAAVSYVPSHGYAVIAGDPLCDTTQYRRIVVSFLQWLKKETNLRPIWILCSADVEEILGEHLGWRSLSCVAEERVDPQRNRAASDGEIARKIRRAEHEGIRIHAITPGEPVPDDIKEKIDARIEDWKNNRKGTQIHLSEITPWRDHTHRRYFYATDSEGKICSFVALAQLAPRHGMQVKYSLDFPGSPSGSIEYIITHAIQSAASSGVKSLTFGGGAIPHLIPGHNLSSVKAKVLQHTYDTIVKQFKLTRKTEFRAKLGAHEEPVYIAYPRHGLGTKGIKAILNFFED
ncbi:aspartate-tRNA(Asn) ligase [Trichophyton soudanense CBS 452.61]|uniref:aspartate--tRNA ligase n=1 Tax=Trichophyton soudanense CBS 452.61 TaxID=1215331 RepID=A0A022Y0Z4_TRISD|nr:aspartate-tRNA(Asn) ligase [Trichophyton soudanense CBS 452.61]EZG08881.1 aspartate-tRNA(Asn) ligase [Trichophyton rubrum CBS 735.88]